MEWSVERGDGASFGEVLMSVFKLSLYIYIDRYCSTCVLVYVQHSKSTRMKSIYPFQELAEWIELGPAQLKTHIWTAETFQCYLEFLAKEVRARRRSLNLSLKHRCLVFCDAATQHSSDKYARLQEAWQEQHNIAPEQQ